MVKIESEMKLKKYKDQREIDDFYWDLSRSLLLRILGRPFFNDNRDNQLLQEIDFILYEVSKRWGLKFPITRLEFGFRKNSIAPFLRIQADQIYYPELVKLSEFYQSPENQETAFKNLELIFEINKS